LAGSAWASILTLLTSSATLVCCALPALLVTLGAGAAVAGLVAAVPQLVWLSEHKAVVFCTAGLLLLVAGRLQWRARFLPCPTDEHLARTCARARRQSAFVYGVSVVLYLIGAGFAFLA
jgi:hypothetical protein